MLQDFARDGEDLLDTLLASARRPADLQAPGLAWHAPALSSGLCTDTATIKIMLTISRVKPGLQGKQGQVLLLWEAPLRHRPCPSMTYLPYITTRAGLVLSSDKCAELKAPIGDLSQSADHKAWFSTT